MATQTQTITVALSPDVQLAKDTYVVRSVAYEHDLPLTAPSTPCKDEQTPFFARCRSLPPRARKAFTLPDAPALPSVIHKGSVIDVMNAELAEVDLEACEANGENAFFVCDLGEVWRAHKVWECAMQPSGPKSTRIEAFYAVKCNPDPTVVRLLAALGLGFDCASQAEIALVLSLGVSPDRIIYANPCKAGSHIRHAAAAGVQLMTFDNHDELIKIAKNHPSARLVLRMLTDDEGSVCRLGSKFGAHLDQIRGLLERARQLNLNVVGVSFHVGSGCSNSQLYDTAIATAKGVFQVGKEEGFDMDFLDIGGGFGGSSFLDSAAVVRASIDAHFPKESGVRVIAEPGRFFVSEAFELATNIIARRGLQSDNRSAVSSTSEADEAIVMYYINDGVYGAFNCIMFDHQVVSPEVLTVDHRLLPSEEVEKLSTQLCSIWGPTCDSIDLVCKETQLPTMHLQIGDWLRWRSMGAYTICAASQFNGFRTAHVTRTVDEKGEVGLAEEICKLIGMP